MRNWRNVSRVAVPGAVVALALLMASACGNPDSASSHQELRTAILDDDVATVRKLLEAGLDPNEQPTDECSTPLALAAVCGDPEIVTLLAGHGVNINAPASPGGKTVLHCVAALEQDAAEMTELLLQGGAEVNAADDEGTTPLMLASARGHEETVKVLLAARPDLELRSAAGKTAVEMALAANQLDVVGLLRRAGAKLVVPGAADEAAEGPSGLTAIPTALGLITLGETFDELQQRLEAGERVDMKVVSPTKTVELRRFNNQLYRLTFERDGKTGPHRLTRIDVE